MVLDGYSHEIIDACRAGQPEAFRALFEAYKDRVYSIALRYSGDHAAAMDITQDTFLKLFSSIGDFRGGASDRGEGCIQMKIRGVDEAELRARHGVNQGVSTTSYNCCSKRTQRATLSGDLLG